MRENAASSVIVSDEEGSSLAPRSAAPTERVQWTTRQNQQPDTMLCLARADRIVPLVAGLGAVIAGGVMLWLGLPMFLKLTALDVDTDFPLMQTSTLAECSSGTDECLPGQCIVVGLWTLSLIHI